MPVPERLKEVKFDVTKIKEVDNFKTDSSEESYDNARKFYNSAYAMLDVVKTIVNKEGYAKKYPELRKKLDNFDTKKKINKNNVTGAVLVDKDNINELVSDVLTSDVLVDVMADPAAAGMSDMDAAAFYIGLIMPFEKKDNSLASYFIEKNVDKNVEEVNRFNAKNDGINKVRKNLNTIKESIEKKPGLKDAVEELTFSPEQKKVKAEKKAAEEKKKADEIKRENPKFERLNEIKFKHSNNLKAIDGVNMNSEQEERTVAAAFYNNVYAALDVVKGVVNKKDFAKDYPELKNKLEKITTTSKITRDNVVGALMADGAPVAEAVTEMLECGILGKIMENPKKAGMNEEQQAAFYVNIVQPFAKNDGKLAKHFIGKHYDTLTNMEESYEKKDNATKAFLADAKKINDMLTENDELSEAIEKYVNNRDVKKKKNNEKKIIDDDSILDINFDNKNNNIINDNIIINENPDIPKAGGPKKNSGKKAWRDTIRQNLYESKGKPDGLSYNDAVKSFRSVRLLSLGASSTEHDILNESLDDFKQYYEKNKDNFYFANLRTMSPPDRKLILAEKIYKLETMSRQAKSYIDMKTNEGQKVPGTPAGTDRLLGAFEIDRNVKQMLKETEEQIKDLGLADSLEEFKEDMDVNMYTLKVINEKISGIAEFDKKDPVRKVEESFLLAQQAAYQIKEDMQDLEYDGKYDEFKDMSVGKIAKTLSHDDSFDAACKLVIRKCGSKGPKISENLILLDQYMEKKAAKADELNNGMVIDQPKKKQKLF